MSAAGILRAERVTKRFDRRRGGLDMLRARRPAGTVALSSVSLAVDAGEALSVVGESGSGKSTLARCLTALHGCDGGRVLFRGRDLATMTGPERRAFHRRVQLVFQNPFGAMNPRMSVRQALGEALHVHAICPASGIEAEIRSLLERVRLSASALDRRPHEFSGGQLQRVALARALSVRPEIIVADEVVSALDVSVQADIVNLLLALQAELGVAILFIAHDLRLVRHISHRVAVMYRGTLVELAGSEALFANPLHPYTRRLVASVPTRKPGERSAAPAARPERGTPVAAPVARGCVFRPSCVLAGPRCAVEAPELRPAGRGRSVACHAVAGTAGADP